MEQIPELNLTDTGFQEETVDIPLKVNGKDEKVVLRKLSAGVRGRIRNLCTKTKYLAGQPQIDINDAELEVMLLQAAIKTAPFPHELKDVKGLPSDVFDYLITAFAQFADLTDKKKDLLGKV